MLMLVTNTLMHTENEKGNPAIARQARVRNDGTPMHEDKL